MHSQIGIGTKFTLTLPITLAIVSALVLRVREQTYAIPLSVVSEALFFDERSVRRVDGREVASCRVAVAQVEDSEVFTIEAPRVQAGS